VGITSWLLSAFLLYLLKKILCMQVKGVEQELDAEDDEAALTSQME
jgi:hypothetical protein